MIVDLDSRLAVADAVVAGVVVSMAPVILVIRGMYAILAIRVQVILEDFRIHATTPADAVPDHEMTVDVGEAEVAGLELGVEMTLVVADVISVAAMTAVSAVPERSSLPVKLWREHLKVCWNCTIVDTDS